MSSDGKELLRRVVTCGSILFLTASLVIRPLVSGETSGLDQEILFQLFPLFAAMLWLMRMILDREMRYRLTGVELPLAAFVVILCASVLWASCKILAAANAFGWTVDVVLFLTVVQVINSGNTRRRLERIFLATGFIIALYGIYQRFIGFPEMTSWVSENVEETRQMLGLGDQHWEDFKSRLATYEIFSTFVIPNALAGYFLMVIPVLITGLIINWRSRSRSMPAFIFKAAALLAILAATLMTGAKGAWACLPIQAIVFVLLLKGLMPNRRRRQFVGAIAITVAAAAVALSTVPQLHDYAFGLWDSLYVRFGYWEGAWRIITDGENFIRGIGAGNFQELYPGVKPVEASEVQKAHNHFLQLWAELGLFGLAGFVGVWILIGLNSIRKPLANPEESLPADAREATFVLLGGCFGFFVASVYASPFRNLPTSTDYKLIGIVLFVLWLAFILVNERFDDREPSENEAALRRAGYLTGIFGILLHSVIDFDLDTAGCSQSLWLLAGLAVGLNVSQKEKRIPLSSGGQLALTVAPLLVLFVLTSLVFPKVANSELLRGDARDRVLRSLKKGKVQRLDLLQQGIQQLHEAAQDNPYEPETFFELGMALQYRYGAAMDPNDVLESYRAFKTAMSLAPDRAGYALRLGQFLEAIAARPPSVFVRSILPEYASTSLNKLKNNYYRPALAEYENAARLYPTKPSFHLPIADLLWKVGKKEEAVKKYRMILKLDDQIHTRWKILRLQPSERKRAEVRVGARDSDQ